MSDRKYDLTAEDFADGVSLVMTDGMAQAILKGICRDLLIACNQLERSLLWVIHEQCEYAGKAYAKLLIHGQEAFDALGIKDGCDISEIEERLFVE